MRRWVAGQAEIQSGLGFSRGRAVQSFKRNVISPLGEPRHWKAGQQVLYVGKNFVQLTYTCNSSIIFESSNRSRTPPMHTYLILNKRTPSTPSIFFVLVQLLPIETQIGTA